MLQDISNGAEPARRRLIIIGGGFSGAALALETARVSGGAIEIMVIDRLGGFGAGVAYSTKNPVHLLNVHAERMSARPDASDDYLDWLRARTGAEPDRHEFAPRALYGEYLAANMRAARDSGAVQLMQDEAVALRRDREGFTVSLASGASVEADAVVLALGNPAATARFDSSALAPHQFIADPWDGAAIASISADQDVLLLGAGLTMIDMVLSLTPRGGKLIAMSRRGLVPRIHATGAPHRSQEPVDLPLRLSDALKTLRREARTLHARGEPWQRLMDRLRPDARRFWTRLPEDVQKRFLRHARPYWDAHRHRASQVASAQITAMQASGALLLLAGKIASATQADGAVRVTYRPRGKRELSQLDVSCIINCTGPDPDPRRSTSPLLMDLVKSGLARTHATGIGLDISEDARVIGADGAPKSNLFALGPPTQGAYWESTAVPEIRKAAGELARVLTAS